MINGRGTQPTVFCFWDRPTVLISFDKQAIRITFGSHGFSDLNLAPSRINNRNQTNIQAIRN